MTQTQSQDHKQVQDFKDGVQKLGHRAGDVKESLSEMARDAASTAKAGAQEASKRVEQTVEAGKKGAAQAIESLTDHISENPLKTIGIALGVGLVIGFLMRGSHA